MNPFDERSAAIARELANVPPPELARRAYDSLQRLTTLELISISRPLKAKASKPVFPQWLVEVDAIPARDGVLCRVALEGPDRRRHRVEVLWGLDPERREAYCQSHQAGVGKPRHAVDLDDGVAALAEWERRAIAVPERLVHDGWRLDWITPTTLKCAV